MASRPRPATRRPRPERAWLDHLSIVAAYREQFTVKTDDPSQPLGPYAEPGTPARKPYWHAAESVIAARRLAGLDTPATAATPDAQARAKVAADIYRALPIDKRAEISKDMADSLGPLWFGGHAELEEDATTQSVHAVALTSTLASRGHMEAADPAKRQAVSEPLPDTDPTRCTAHSKPVANTRQMPPPSNAPYARQASSLRPAPFAELGHQPRLG